MTPTMAAGTSDHAWSVRDRLQPLTATDILFLKPPFAMIIWRGKGFVIALIAFGGLLLAELGTSATFGKDYYGGHGWPKLAGFWIGALATYALRSWLGVGQEQTLVDKSTGRDVVLNSEATLFFVPARFWPAILGVFGIVALLV